MKKIKLLILPILALASCAPAINNKVSSSSIDEESSITSEEHSSSSEISSSEEEKSNHEEFLAILDSLKPQNYTITLNGDVFEYLGEDIINTKFNGVPYQGGYIRKDNVGIFDYVLINDNVEVQGMISLNTEISPLDLLANPEYLFRINRNKWKTTPSKKKETSLNFSSLTTEDKYFISWSFDIDADISSLSSISDVTVNFKDEYKFTVKYKDKNSGLPKTKTFIVDKIGETENTPMTNYLNNGSFEKKNDWTNFQKSFLNQYELGDLDFLNSLTVGASVDFSYLNIAGIVNVYDLYGNEDQIDDIKEELYELGYEIIDSANDITVALCKAVDENNKVTHAKKISFKYIPWEELSYGEQVTCPNGYTQLSYSHSIYYEPTDLSGVNDALSDNGIPELDDSELIKSVMFSDVTELYNAEWKMMIEEANEEEGIEEEILDVLDASYVIHIYPQAGSRLKEDVNVYAKAYLDKLIADGYRNRSIVFNEFLDIDEPIEDDVPYDTLNHASKAKIDTINDRIIYIEVNSYDYNYAGYLEVIVEIYTRYGAEKLI